MPCGGCGDSCKCSTNQCGSSCKCDSSCSCSCKRPAADATKSTTKK